MQMVEKVRTKAHLTDSETQLEKDNRAVALMAAEEAIVLLENKGTLPLAVITAFSLSQIPVMPIMERRFVNARIVIPINVRTEKIQIRFSNRYGKTEGRIRHATVMLCDGREEVMPDSLRDITVNGKTELRIAAGQEIASDPIAIRLHPGSRLAISVYTEEKPGTNASAGYHVIRKAGKGDLSHSTYQGTPPSRLMTKLIRQPPMSSIPYFRAVDVYTDEQPRIVACLGDSITAQGRWTQPLTDRLYEAYPGKLCLTNHGICGNRLAADAPDNMCIFGESAVKRMDFDVLTDQGLSDVIVALGVNDVNMESFPTENQNAFLQSFESAFRELVRNAHDHGISVTALGVYPAAFKEKEYARKEEARLAVNGILRSGADRYVDLDAVLKSPAGHGYRDGFAYPDGLHLNRTGGEKVAGKIMQEMFS